MIQIRCADCGCYPIDCKYSNSQKECPSCSWEDAAVGSLYIIIHID